MHSGAVTALLSQVQGGAEVRYGSDHKFRHEDFWQQTGLAVYPPFMRGGGYIVSADAARALLDVVKLAQTDIFTTPVEDAAIGFYMACLKLRRFNSSRWWCVSDHLPCSAPNSMVQDCCVCFWRIGQPWLLVMRSGNSSSGML